MERIDAHQHFWQLNDTEYAWLNGDRAALRQDFLPTDLKPLLRAHDIAGCIAVHARQMVKETPWLLGLADKYSWIRGVVGWAPLLVNSGEPYLEEHADHPKLVGVRHLLHDGSGNDYLQDEQFNEGIRRLMRYGLVFDLLLRPRQLTQVVAFVDRHPNQVFVVDHVAKPRIAAHDFDEEWRVGIRELARRPNVYCKVSGMLTEIRDADWSADTLLPTFDAVLNAFGPRRLIYGSDWPVCLLRAGYARWASTVDELVGPLRSSDREAFWGGNAERAYGLNAFVADVDVHCRATSQHPS